MAFNLIIPQSAPLDPSGRFSREWQRFLVDLGNAVVAAAVLPIETTTASATPSALTETGAPASPSNIPVLLDSTTTQFQVSVVAHKDRANSAGWIIEGLIARDSGAGTATIIGTNVTRSWGSNAGAPPAGWGCVVTADTVNGGILVTGTGAAATTIYWSGNVRITSATG